MGQVGCEREGGVGGNNECGVEKDGGNDMCGRLWRLWRRDWVERVEV